MKSGDCRFPGTLKGPRKALIHGGVRGPWVDVPTKRTHGSGKVRKCNITTPKNLMSDHVRYSLCDSSSMVALEEKQFDAFCESILAVFLQFPESGSEQSYQNMGF